MEVLLYAQKRAAAAARSLNVGDNEFAVFVESLPYAP